jgi:hypothetical protein
MIHSHARHKAGHDDCCDIAPSRLNRSAVRGGRKVEVSAVIPATTGSP